MNQHMRDMHQATNTPRTRGSVNTTVIVPASTASKNMLPSVGVATTASGSRVPLSIPGTVRGMRGRVGESSLASTELGKLESSAGYFNTLKDVIVNRLGFRPDSSEYFMKALHPMDEEIFGGTRIPDSTNDATVALELRSSTSFSKPSGIGEGSWDLDVYFPPFPGVAYAYNARAAGTKSDAKLTYVYYPSSEPGTLGPTTKQSSLNLNADAYRGVYRGATFQMTASSLNNDGEVYAGQYGIKFREYTVPETVSTSGDVVLGSYVKVICDQVPLTTEALAQKVSGYVQLPAKCGLYLPIRYTDPVHLFAEGDCVPYITGANANQHNDPQAGDSLVAKPVNFMMGVVMFRGLNDKATLALKTRTGLEAIPDATGTWGAFSESSPVMDRDALDLVIKLRHTLALAYPASYNDLGAIWNAIRSGFEALARPTWQATRQVGRFLGRTGIGFIDAFGNGLEQASDNLLEGLDAMLK